MELLADIVEQQGAERAAATPDINAVGYDCPRVGIAADSEKRRAG